jgi:hypothetical protein
VIRSDRLIIKDFSSRIFLQNRKSHEMYIEGQTALIDPPVFRKPSNVKKTRFTRP